MYMYIYVYMYIYIYIYMSFIFIIILLLLINRYYYLNYFPEHILFNTFDYNYLTFVYHLEIYKYCKCYVYLVSIFIDFKSFPFQMFEIRHFRSGTK